ncbi:hypothetical protein F2Q68_00041312 [Brassica cretica]|uniref:Uncharacterized protein n=2 Tax=Brassica cretica TaxID=69181 RepID=A0A8S9MIU8_BRACR|nr:hypothetical protein F2Q68_00041312 [Brassica cretica]KAF3496146.1 hypothetical protein DY000_02055797 [Brassica cretica]
MNVMRGPPNHHRDGAIPTRTNYTERHVPLHNRHTAGLKEKRILTVAASPVRLLVLLGFNIPWLIALAFYSVMIVVPRLELLEGLQDCGSPLGLDFTCFYQ